MNLNHPPSRSERLDLTETESILVNFLVRIEKTKAGCQTCHVEDIKFQSPTYEKQKFFLPFVSAVSNGLDSYLKQIRVGQLPQHTLKGGWRRWFRTCIENTRFGRRTNE
jgi:hypothetical protein